MLTLARDQKEELNKNLAVNVEEVESYTAQLMSTKDMLQEVWKSTQAVMKSSDVKLVKKQKRKVKHIQDVLEHRLPTLEISGTLAAKFGECEGCR